MEEILIFLRELKDNNNREWFEDNRVRYKALQEQYNDFIEQLIEGIALFDPLVKNLDVKQCTYRIYRDVRFSPNKEPYKTHMGAYICPGGKKSGLAGYYFHLEDGKSLLAAGLHCPEPKVVKSIREEIADNYEAFASSIAKAKGFTIDESSKLQRVPRGFASDQPFSDHLKLKEFDLIKHIDINGDLLGKVLADFKQTKEFNDILNRAVTYAQQEM